jgi:hypothetical protein
MRTKETLKILNYKLKVTLHWKTVTTKLGGCGHQEGLEVDGMQILI